MNLSPDPDELAIESAAANFLSGVMPISRLHAPVGGTDMPPHLREALGDMGWFALSLAEAEGGSGLGAVEHALFFREVGRRCGPVDILAQSLSLNLPLDPGLRSRIMSGTIGVVLLAADGGGHRLIGSDKAELGLLVTRDGAALYELSAIPAEARPALDPANSFRYAKTLGNPAVEANDWRMWHLGELGIAAMLVGIAEAALDLIVEYAKVRETFGRPIGAWQAVRHPCADMAVRGEAARAQLWYAAASLKEGRADAGAHIDAARHLAAEAAVGNADASIQLHGGIGITDEHDCHLLLKHALLLVRLFGAKRELLARLLHAELAD